MNFLQKVFGFIQHPTQSRTMGLVVLLLILVAVPLTVVISQQQQETRQRASGQDKCDSSIFDSENSYFPSNGSCASNDCTNNIYVQDDTVINTVCWPKRQTTPTPTPKPSPTPTTSQVRAPVNEKALYTPDCEPLYKPSVERCYVMDHNNNNADLNTLLSQGWAGNPSPSGTGTCGSGISYQMKEPDKFGKPCSVTTFSRTITGICKWDNNFINGVCDDTGAPTQSPPTQPPTQTGEAPAATTTTAADSNAGKTTTNDLCIRKSHVEELKNKYYASSNTTITLQQVNALEMSRKLDTNTCRNQ